MSETVKKTREIMWSVIDQLKKEPSTILQERIRKYEADLSLIGEGPASMMLAVAWLGELTPRSHEGRVEWKIRFDRIVAPFWSFLEEEASKEALGQS